MRKASIDLYMPLSAEGNVDNVLDSVVANDFVKTVTFWCTGFSSEKELPQFAKLLTTSSLSSSALFFDMAEAATSDYILYVSKVDVTLPTSEVLAGYMAAMESDNSVFLYSDCYKIIDGERSEAPKIDYQAGSLRNDFDFGSIMLIRTSALKKFRAEESVRYKYAGFYQMLLSLSRIGHFTHIKEYTYQENEQDKRKSGEKQFDYVNPAQRDVQIEMEQVCTEHLKRIGGYLRPYEYEKIELSNGSFPVEASVVIPVLNRKTTIADAINSVLMQQTDFDFNIIVVDNHSTDGTSEIIDGFADTRVIHLIPGRNDLQIGGCWNLAVNSEHCGRFAIQLDSDDLYSGHDTLQRIVDSFYAEKCAMLIGSYRICDFHLETLPPGVIDHREWSDENGRNNALRINGLGAPRAFYTPVIRSVGFPNVSYGEDYAVGLQISRTYKIGRIYDVLYLCRRWGGNSDAALSCVKVNANNFYKDSIRTRELMERICMNKSADIISKEDLSAFYEKQLNGWPEVATAYKALENIKVKNFANGLAAQFNPARIRSTGAAVDAKSIAERPCFLCAKSRNSRQLQQDVCGDMEVLVNPYPILPEHYTIPTKKHTPQKISSMYQDMLLLAQRWQGMTLFYNGARCGASAPDHAHLQAVRSSDVPMLGTEWSEKIFSSSQMVVGCKENGICFSAGYVVPLFIVKARSVYESQQLFTRLMCSFPCADEAMEPDVNLYVIYDDGGVWNTFVVPRSKHRPDCYFAEGDARCLVSPGALDMAGLLILAREQDYDKMDADNASAILKEVALPVQECMAIIEKLKA